MHTDQRDNDDYDPGELDRRGSDLDFAEELDSPDVDQDDDDPEDTDPRRRRHFVGPKIEHGDHTLYQSDRTLSQTGGRRTCSSLAKVMKN